MTSEQAQALIGMIVVLGILVLLVLPALLGIAHDRRVDRQLREAEKRRTRSQKSSSRSTVPSTATWYADGRRSKKLVSS
jgi:type II secretory pathway pseudopilin PulG